MSSTNSIHKPRWPGMVGGYGLYGDAPQATPAKAAEAKPAPRRALKRKREQEKPNIDLGCPRAKIPRPEIKPAPKRVSWFTLQRRRLRAKRPRLTINRGGKRDHCLGCPRFRLATYAKAEEKKPAPRRALKRKIEQEKPNIDLGCPRAKIPRPEIKPAPKRVSWFTLQRRRLRAKRPHLTIIPGGKRDHCLGCPCFPLVTYAKAEEKKPAPRRALKRKREQEKPNIDLGCPRAKIPRPEIKPAPKRVSWFTLQRRRLRSGW